MTGTAGPGTPVPPEAVVAGGFSSALARPRPPVATRYTREAVGFIKDVVGSRSVLEVGAGTGILTGQLHRSGVTITALEPSGQDLAQLRRALPAVPAVRSAIDSLPVRSGACDALLAHHDAAYLDEFARVLTDGGLLLLVGLVPTRDPDEFVLAQAAAELFGEPVHHRFTPRPVTSGLVTPPVAEGPVPSVDTSIIHLVRRDRDWSRSCG